MYILYIILYSLYIIHTSLCATLRVLVGCVSESLYDSFTVCGERGIQDGFAGDVVAARHWVTSVVLDVDCLTHFETQLCGVGDLHGEGEG